MSARTRLWLCTLGVLSVAVCLRLASESTAGGDAGTKAAIQKIAAAIEKGDEAGAKKQAQALAKKVDDVEEVMNVFRPRTKKGIGVGDKAGAIQPDGIELQLNKIGRDGVTPVTAKKDAHGFEKMSYVIAAVAEYAMAKEVKDEGKKKAKDWKQWAKDMREAAPALAAAAKSKSPAEIKKACEKINNACNSCHSVFK